MTNLQKRFVKASDLVAILGLTNDDLVCANFYGRDEWIHLEPASFVRVAMQLKVRKSAINVQRSEAGNIHVNFVARKMKFVTVVAAEEVAEFQNTIEAKPVHIEGDSRHPRLLVS